MILPIFLLSLGLVCFSPFFTLFLSLYFAIFLSTSYLHFYSTLSELTLLSHSNFYSVFSLPLISLSTLFLFWHITLYFLTLFSLSTISLHFTLHFSLYFLTPLFLLNFYSRVSHFTSFFNLHSHSIFSICLFLHFFLTFFLSNFSLQVRTIFSIHFKMKETWVWK